MPQDALETPIRGLWTPPEVLEALEYARAQAEGWPLIPYVCTYCHQPAGQLDHLLPLQWTGEALRHLVPKVPSCADCNVRLGAHLDPDILGRKRFVAAALRSKYSRLLRGKLWSLEQLEEEVFEPLRSGIRAQNQMQSWLLDRLNVLDGEEGCE